MDDNKRSGKPRVISLEWALSIAYVLIAIIAGVFYEPIVRFVAVNTGAYLSAEAWAIIFMALAFVFICISCKGERLGARLLWGLLGYFPGSIVGIVFQAIEERKFGGDGEGMRSLWLFLLLCVLPFVLFILYGKLEDRKKRGKQY